MVWNEKTNNCTMKGNKNKNIKMPSIITKVRLNNYFTHTIRKTTTTTTTYEYNSNISNCICQTHNRHNNTEDKRNRRRDLNWNERTYMQASADGYNNSYFTRN